MAIEKDFIVIGSGVAGLTFALKVCKFGSVGIITKEALEESATKYAQGGIATVLDKKRDSIESHVKDTLSCGAGLCHPDAVSGIVGEGEIVIRDLLALGACFTVDDEGELSLAREGGHEFARVVRADDMTGREVIRALITKVESQSEVTFFDDHFCSDLLIDSRGNCCGGVMCSDHWPHTFAGSAGYGLCGLAPK